MYKLNIKSFTNHLNDTINNINNKRNNPKYTVSWIWVPGHWCQAAPESPRLDSLLSSGKNMAADPFSQPNVST